MSNKEIHDPTTHELTQKIIKSDKRSALFLKLTVGFALVIIIATLGYLVYRNNKSDSEIQKVEAEITVLNEEQLQTLNQIKDNQGTNKAIFKAEFQQIQNALQEQNVYLKCLTTKDTATCVAPQNQVQ